MADDISKQKLLLSYLLADESVFATCRGILDPTYFDRELSPVVEYVLDHSDKYNEIPSAAMVEVETGVHLDQSPEEGGPNRQKWCCDEIEKFCRTSAVCAAVMQAYDTIAAGDLDGLVEPIKKACLVGLHRDIGTDYFEDPASRLRKMLENSSYPIGFKVMDDVLFGGVDVGGVNLVIGPSGSGKSFFLANIAKNFMERKKNVIYVTLELNEPYVCKRMDSMTSGVSSRNIFSKIDEVSYLVKKKSPSHGILRVKYLPSGSSMADIEAVYRETVLQTGEEFHCMCIDYFGLMSPKAKMSDMGNVSVRDKYIAEEMRAFFIENDLWGFTAQQMVKGSESVEEHTMGQAAGGATLINTVDNAWSIFQSKDLREQCLFKVQFLKTRSSSGVGQTVYLKVDPETMRLSDADAKDQEPRARAAPAKAPRAGGNLDRLNTLRAGMKGL